ncbi:MAG: hypothetical protein ACMUHX_01985 [bacterium]
MKKKHLLISLILFVAVFIFINFAITLTSAFGQVQETEDIDPADIGVLYLTNLVAEGNLSSVGHNGSNYTGEVDWYIFTSAIDTNATIALSFDFGNNYDLYLYDANGSILVDDSVDANPETLTYEISAFVTYLICVVGYEGSPGNYTLTISPEDVGPPIPNDTVELEFTDLTTEGNLSSVGNDGEGYTGEVDWYVFTPSVPAIATITLSFDSSNDYDLYLYDANGSMPLEGSTDGNPEILVHEVTAYTTYLICVAGWTGSPGNYTLTISPGAVEIPAEMDLPKNWSMISLPVRPDSLKLSELFPGAVVVYGYTKEKGYVRVSAGEDMKIGKGYWILLNDARKYTLTGRPINEYNLRVYYDGWDMIGGCTSGSRALTTNGHIEVIYRFVRGSGYLRVLESENLEPGRGFWIMYKNVMNQCELKVKVIDT